MPSPDEYRHADELDHIPAECAQNYRFEHQLLVELLRQDARVLQVGSMDGARAVRLLKARSDLQFTGLDIEEDLITIARQNTDQAGVAARFILGDIVDPSPELDRRHFDYVLCLNNTLGYIPEQEAALRSMRSLGGQVLISVFGEKFTDQLARDYFASLDNAIKRIEGDTFILKDDWLVRRYAHAEVEGWGGEVRETPLGYLCALSGG